jgi:hypothetical protein
VTSSPTRGTLVLVAGLLFVAPVSEAQPTAGEATAMYGSCRVTLRNGVGILGNPMESAYGNGRLSVGLWPDGVVLFEPRGPGFITSNGSLGMKFGWRRGERGRLRIEGRRLDGMAEPLRAEIPDGNGDFGFQPSALIFPTPGCWEVTGRVGQASLTFTTMVVKIGDGPARFDP